MISKLSEGHGPYVQNPSEESTKKRRKEVVAAMPSFDIFLHLAILCCFTLRYTNAPF